jgi:hypothetical protein
MHGLETSEATHLFQVPLGKIESPDSGALWAVTALVDITVTLSRVKAATCESRAVMDSKYDRTLPG